MERIDYPGLMPFLECGGTGGQAVDEARWAETCRDELEPVL